MTDVIATIKSEHVNMAKALACLEGATRELRGAKEKPDLELLYTVLYYIRLFPLRLHHPKEEEYVFRALAHRNPGARTIISALQKEHADGEHLIAAIEAALRRYDRDFPAGFQALEAAVLDFVELERRHMRREEDELMPLARLSLTKEDWREVENAFEKNRGSLFVEDLELGFEGLRQRIEAMRLAGRPAA